MSYLHLTSTRVRERTPEYDSLFSRPSLLRSDSNKRRRIISLSDDDDDDADDYPYGPNHKKPSRALMLRNAPSQLERYNIWSDRRTHKKRSDDEDSADERERRKTYERRRTYKYVDHRPHHSDDEDNNERYKLKVKATFTKPRSHSHGRHSHHHHHEEETSFWPSTSIFRNKERWSDESWETRERSRERRRRDSFWDDGEWEEDSWSRYRKVKATKTEEFRPLSGWRRSRIVLDD